MGAFRQGEELSLIHIFSGITFPAMAICTSFPVREEINGTLTMNNWYAFDGAAAFDGSRKFNAQIMQEEF